MIYYRDWRDAIRSDFAAKYWRWTKLCVNLNKYPDQEQNLIDSTIIRIVPIISCMECWPVWSAVHNIVNWLFESIRNGKTVQLKKFNITQNIHHVNPDVVAEAAMKLETLQARFSNPQLEAILIRLAATEDSRLKQLYVNSSLVNLSSLNPEVVAMALTKLESVGPHLSWGLLPTQLNALLTRICNFPNLMLNELDVVNNDFSIIPPEVLVGAIQRLRIVHFLDGRMTEEQATAILTIAKERILGRIQFIHLCHVAGMSSVSPTLLLEAKLNKKLLWNV